MKSLFKANIFHKRFLPKINQFNYSGFYIRISIDNLQNLKGLFFGVNKFNLFSFYTKDHGYKDGRDLNLWVKDQLKQVNIKSCDEVILQTFPRVFGFVFNPVSFWFCYYQKKLIAVISEVNNTFGESHNYLITTNKSSLPKEFHVSPFYPRQGYYDFDFSIPNLIVINYRNQESLQLTTCIKGQEIPWSNAQWIKLFFIYPFYTFFVVILIHYQALKLFIKKNIFYKKPKKLKKELTHEH